MRQKIQSKLGYHFSNPKYLLFLLSIVLLIIIPPLDIVSESATILFDVIYFIVIFLGSLYTSNSVRNLILLIILGTLTYLTHIFPEVNSHYKLLNGLFTIGFFVTVFMNLIKFVLFEKVIDDNGIYAAISGYLVLGIASSSLFYIIEGYYPGSFTIAEGYTFYDFLYYSYITLTTVGFGDILPVHPFAKALTIIVSICGQLYLTILMAIIIGKYMFYLSKKHVED
jgi:voltage-gated potassium channel